MPRLSKTCRPHCSGDPAPGLELSWHAKRAHAKRTAELESELADSQDAVWKLRLQAHFQRWVVRARHRTNVRGYAVRRVYQRYLTELTRHGFRAWHRGVRPGK